MRRLPGILAAALAAAILAAPAAAEAPTRIVVAGGDLTEIVHALGGGERIVGVDTTSLHPAAVTELPQIGYVRALAPEGVLSLRPDLLIGAADAGPADALIKLRAAGLRVEIAPNVEGADSVPAKIGFVGEILGLEAEAEALSVTYAAEMAELAEIVAGIASRPKVLFILAMQGNAPLVGGDETAAGAVIALAGADNAATGFEGYKPMSREAVLAAAPDVVLMMDDRLDTFGGPDAILALPEIAPTPAGRNGRLVTMDGLLLLGFGPRTPEAVRQLAAELHPEDGGQLAR